MRNPNDANLLTKIVEQKGDFTVMSFDGDLDKLGLDSVKEQINDLVGKTDKSYLVFDFSRLNFINSESIGFIIMVHSHLIKKGGKLVIIGASAHVFDVLQVIGITQLIQTFPDVQTFESSIKQGAR
jgi:anti-sigma B factor antagonist